ncbi:hypothetical protein QNI16_36515 [Cytophagaceae bacterium YF14B1]|uniref:DUF7878 domain-containing protein n=1 Tax=Xanthocytophaga flava TaxID=3048013 RepID=A0AAE3QZ16_9BACT|nr:hypothetical protein [Xanthocytophaga flavus]MDJ1486043.1 hypothetical protein [Xanthocytophaga flavus]
MKVQMEMVFTFEITTVPEHKELRYYWAHLEGSLAISVDNILFFEESDICLIELANDMHNWLLSDKLNTQPDFIYKTVDYYPEPILIFEYINYDFYKIESIWQKTELTHFVPKNSIITAFETFLKNLEKELAQTLTIDLNELLRDLNQVGDT